MLKTIFLLGLMVATVFAGRHRWNDQDCKGSDGKCCSTKCPSGWKGFDGHCYFISANQSTHRDSQAFCSSQHANLVKVNNEEESHFLKIQIATFVTGCPTADSKFRSGVSPPLCYFQSQDKVSKEEAELFCERYGAEIASVPDFETLQFININYPIGSVSGLWTSITYNIDISKWVDIEGNVVPEENLFWNIARNQPRDPPNQPCVRVQNNLFHDIECETDTYALCQIGSYQSTWIGLTDALGEDVFTDLHGNELDSDSYEEFEGDEPDGGTSANCVAYQIGTDGGYSWGDMDCNKHYNFICELDPDCLS